MATSTSSGKRENTHFAQLIPILVTFLHKDFMNLLDITSLPRLKSSEYDESKPHQDAR